MDAKGWVIAIDRTRGVVHGMLDSGARIVAAYSGSPPPPLSAVRFSSDGPSWRVAHIQSITDLLLHDHFLGGTLGDTSWTYSGSGSAQVTSVSDTYVDGIVALTGGGGQLTKFATGMRLSADRAYWVSARVRITGNLLTTGFGWGLANATRSTAAMVGVGNGTAAWLAMAANEGGAVSPTTAPTAATDVWQTVDLVLIPGQQLSIWVDGDGPHHADDATRPYIPSDGRRCAPQVWVSAGDSETDWIHTETFTDPLRPEDAGAFFQSELWGGTS